MHSHEVKEHTTVRHLSHLNFLFSGWGSHIYDKTMAKLASSLYQCVIEDMISLQLTKGKVLDAGTGPGTLVRDIARRFPELQVYGIDLSKEMIQLAREHAKREQIDERIHFTVGDVAQLPYPDQSFDLVVSSFSMHHWHELEQPLRELYRVLQPAGRLWIYDFRFISPQIVEKAKAKTLFGRTSLEHQLVRTGWLPFAICRRFELQK